MFMEKDYDPNLFYAKATFNFNEDGKVELISNNQTEDLLILIFQETRYQNYLLSQKNNILEKNKKYLGYIVILLCLNFFVLSLMFYAITLFLKI